MPKNPMTEQFLNRQGVTFSFEEEFAIPNIDVKKGRQNQARITFRDAIDQDLVDDYAAKAKDGSDCPPIILIRPSRGRPFAAAGNHRIAAYMKAGRKTIPAYVVTTDDKLVQDRIAWSENNWSNGVRLSYEDCLVHATNLVRVHGVSHKDAALEMGVHAATLSSRMRSLDVREAAQRQDVTLNKNFTDEKALALNPVLALGEDVLAEAVKVVNDNGLTAKDTEELVRSIKRARTVDDKKNVLADFAAGEKAQARRAETKGGRVKPAVRPSTTLMNHLRAVERLAEDHGPAGLRPPQIDFKEARECAMTVRDFLTRLFGLGVLNPETAAQTEAG